MARFYRIQWPTSSEYASLLIGTVEHLERTLLDVEIFSVDVTLSPGKEADQEAWDGWQPNFGVYDVVVLAYNGEPWPERVQEDFEEYVSGGGSILVQHAANNPFPGWEAYD